MRLSLEERECLDQLIRKGKSPALRLMKVRILLKTDVGEGGEGRSDSRVFPRKGHSGTRKVRLMRRMLREPRPVSCLSTLDCLISLFRALDTAVFLCGMHCGNMRPVVENSPVLVRKVFLAGNLSIAKSSTKLCMVGQGRRRSQGPSASRRAKEKRRPDPGITACPGIQPAYFVWIVFHAVLFCCGDILRKGIELAFR